MSITGFRVVLPPPWERIRLVPGYEDHVSWIMDRSAQRVRKAGNMPPDTIAKVRAQLEGKLLSDLARIVENGGTDYFLPTDLMHGVALNANFTVTESIPDATIKPEDVPRVLASMAGEDPHTRVEIDETEWVRREMILRADPERGFESEVDARKVEYLTAVPDDARRWVIVSFTTVGDGDPDSAPTKLVVDLFDAIMSTWRWTPVSPTEALADRDAAV